MDVFALDFDGVLCDSARETALSAWRAGSQLLPGVFAGPPPDACVDRFVRLRPYLHTGYQAVLILLRVLDGETDESIAGDFEGGCVAAMARHGLDRERLVRAFGSARDSWIREDEESWLASHRFFPGTIAGLRQVAETAPVYIVTTKQERFVHRLLRAAGAADACTEVYGLDHGLSKSAVLHRLCGAPAHVGARVHFVEDRLETLREVAYESFSVPVRLYYVTWGYGTPADLVSARADGRFTVWEPGDFLRTGL